MLVFTVASTGLKVLVGFTERVALPVETPAVVNTRCVVISIDRRRTLTAGACYVKGKQRNIKEIYHATIYLSPLIIVSE